MHWLLGGYMWLFVHRPFERYPVLGDMQLERVYMLVMIVCWIVWPNKGLIANRLHAALIGFTFVVTLCWLASPYREQGDATVENYLKVAVFYFLVVTTVRDEAALKRLVGFYLVAVGLYMTHSFLEYCNGRMEWRQGINRMIGVDVTYYDSNSFASTLLLALPLVVPFWARTKSLPVRGLLLAFTGLAMLCILLTGSRTGFMGLALLGVFGVLLSRHRLRMLPLLICVGAIGAVAMPGYLQDRFLTLVDPSYGPKNAQESALGRIAGLWLGVKLWNDSPLLGVGPGAFTAASGSLFNPHNVYGQVISELGTLGAVAWAAVLLCFLLNWLETRRTYRRQRDGSRDFSYLVSRAVALNVVMLLLMGWAGHNLYRYNWLWFAAFQVCALHGIRARVATAEMQLVCPQVPYLAGRRRLGRAWPRPAPGT